MSRLKLRPFTSIRELLGKFIIVCGRGGSGRTTLVRDLSRTLAPNLDAVVAVGLDALASAESTYPSIDVALVERIAEAQQQRQLNTLLVIDMALDRKVLSSDAFRRLIADTRRLTVILSLPSCTILPPNLRPLTHCIFQFNESQVSVRRTLFTHYASFTTLDTFFRIMDKIAVGFQCVVVWHKPRAQCLDEVYYWYVIDDIQRAASVNLEGCVSLFASDEEIHDASCKIIDIIPTKKKTGPTAQAPAAASPTEEEEGDDEDDEDEGDGEKEVPFVDWMRRHFEFYNGNVRDDFTNDDGKFVRDKVGSWFTRFDTIYKLWKADNRPGNETDLGRDLTGIGLREWIVNIKTEEGKRKTSRTRVGIRRRF